MAEQSQRYPRPVTQSLRFDGPVLLRDGRAAMLREASDKDIPALIQLLNRTTDQSIMLRFFGPMHRDERTARFLIRTQIGGVDSGRFKGLCLILVTGAEDAERISAVASCIPLNREEAEVAFLVEDAYQGKGIGTLLIERLAFAAELGGMKRLVATTVADNEAMLKVFEDCGYNPVARLKTGEVRVAFDIEPTAESVQTMEMRDRIASGASVHPIFYPRSIAIVGISRNPRFIGNQLLRNLLRRGYGGKLYPIHRDMPEVEGVPTAASLSDIEEPLDLVVIFVAAEKVVGVARECARNRARVLVVLSDGFSERDAEGRAREQELLQIARGSGMRLVGPNCLGLINTDPESPLHLTFAEVFPPAGSLAMSSQSGSLSLAILDGARDQGIGFSKFISVGNKADLSSNDLLQYWEEDPRSKAILLYLESLGNPRRFARLARRVARKKPVLVVKSSGASEHALELEAFFSQIGVIRTDSLEQMFGVANLLSNQPLLPGNQLAILTNSRGMGEICEQACRSAGLVMAPLGEEARAGIRALMEPGLAFENPVDMTPFVDPANYGRALEYLLMDEGVQVVVAMCIARDHRARANIIAAIQQARRRTQTWHVKPIVCCFMDRLSTQPDIEDQHERIPSYHFPEAAANALSHALKYANWLRRPGGIVPVLDRIDVDRVWQICDGQYAVNPEGGLLDAKRSCELVAAIGVALDRKVTCEEWFAALEAMESMTYPVRLEDAARGRSRGGIQTDEELRAAWEELEDLSPGARLTLAEEIEDCISAHLEITDDPDYGPVALFGLVGVSMDLYHDLACRITPLTDQAAVEMVHGIRSRALLEGYGGRPVVDKEAIIDGLLRLSWLVEEVPVIDSIRLSPVQVLPGRGGLRCSGVQVVLKPQDESSAPSRSTAAGSSRN